VSPTSTVLSVCTGSSTVDLTVNGCKTCHSHLGCQPMLESSIAYILPAGLCVAAIPAQLRCQDTWVNPYLIRLLISYTLSCATALAYKGCVLRGRANGAVWCPQGTVWLFQSGFLVNAARVTCHLYTHRAEQYLPCCHILRSMTSLQCKSWPTRMSKQFNSQAGLSTGLCCTMRLAQSTHLP
jgi:hypothetical protein